MTETAAARLADDADLLTALSNRLTLRSEFNLDSVTASGTVAASDVPLDDLMTLATGSGSIVLTIASGYGDEIRVHLARGGATGQVDGDISSLAPALVDDTDVRDALSDPRRLFSDLRPDLLCTISATVANRDPSFIWVSSEDSFAAIVAKAGRATVIRALGKTERPSRIVIGGNGTFSTHRFVVHDPRCHPDLISSPPPVRTKAMIDRQLPSALDLLPTTGDGLERTRPIFEELAVGAAWLYLAGVEGADGASVQLVPGGPFVALPQVADESLWDLFDYAVRHDDALHVSAVKEAIADAAARQTIDSRVILANAELIVSSAQQQLIAAVVESRRRSREAAAGAALKSAETARSAVRSLQDRLVLALGAAGGVLVTQRLEFGSALIALTLLAIVALVMVGAAIVVFQVELPTASSPIDTLDQDLRALVEGLSDSDVEAVLKLPSVIDAKARLRAARKIAWGLLIAGGVGFAILFAVALASGADSKDGGSGNPTTKTPARTTGSPAHSSSSTPSG